MMIAGLVRDDVRQAITGFPGLSKIPVLGTLFRSRDFVRNETELVIIVTPYLARPVARNDLAKPDDNFNPPSDGAGMFLGRVNRVYGTMQTDLAPTAAITASSATSTSDRGRAHGQDCVEQRHDRSACPVAAARVAPGGRSCRSLRSSVSLLAGCAKRDSITVGAVPDDYRTNHPIVIAEKDAGDRPAGRRGRSRHDANRSASRSTASWTATTGAPRRC